MVYHMDKKQGLSSQSPMSASKCNASHNNSLQKVAISLAISKYA